MTGEASPAGVPAGSGAAVHTVTVGPLAANCYVLVDPASRQAAVIDPGAEPQRILAVLREAGVERVVALVATHGHFDHVGAVAGLRDATGAPFLIHPDDQPMLAYAPEAALLFTGQQGPAVPPPDGLLQEDGQLRVGQLCVEVRHTPGHSPGSISLVVAGLVFSGDALFAGSIGRTDLPGGDGARLLRAIRERLLDLPDPTRVWPGHGPPTTVGRERATNPFLAGASGGGAAP